MSSAVMFSPYFKSLQLSIQYAKQLYDTFFSIKVHMFCFCSEIKPHEEGGIFMWDRRLEIKYVSIGV